MRTREQQRAATIYEQVKTQVLPMAEADRKHYGAMAHQLPLLVRTAGLCQALEFVESRDKAYLNLLLDHLAAAVGVRGRAELLNRSRTDDLEGYMWLTREVMAALVWHKRFAQSILHVKPDDAERDR